MIYFFHSPNNKIYAVESSSALSEKDSEKLEWLFGVEPSETSKSIDGVFLGPRATMITPWSTNAVEITENMGIQGLLRIEQFELMNDSILCDPMISQVYHVLDQSIFESEAIALPLIEISDVAAYNEQEGLSLNTEEVKYLEDLSVRLGRNLTDSEVFGYSQVNSEHCRHKIFNGVFEIDGEEMPSSLFKLIKKTTATHPNTVVSAYKDNVAFVEGPKIEQFAPCKPDVPSLYETKEVESVISLKAETHNFPTTVEPFNGAATGSGGEIRDRMAGGKGSIPLAGTALYMTSYSRLTDDKEWEQKVEPRKWLYQSPIDILIKASDGASDFGNKFGQPLINGSLLTFEHREHGEIKAYDKVIMQAGGIGYGKKRDAQKAIPQTGDDIVILGGDNYRIGMGGAAVSSADTGAMASGIELNAVQRSNPEMQKRVANTVRAMVENDTNAIVSIHDHGAGGHLNCLSELVEDTGGIIDMDALPIGDPSLSSKEIIGNESQERMGLVISPEDKQLLERIAQRERAPMYTVGKVTGDHRFSFVSKKNTETPIDLALVDMFGNSPSTIMKDISVKKVYDAISYDTNQVQAYIRDVLRLESVACKDWLTNKVDRCVGGLVATQQCVGPLQLPLSNCGVMALDFNGVHGVATAMGHAPVSGLIDAAAGARNAISESLTNIVWAPLENGLKSISLSANWMWPCKNEGEDARLYQAVSAVSAFAIELGINIPTGKDSMSMAQKYKDQTVLAPGTVVISATGHCNDVRRTIEPVLQKNGGSIYYIDLSSDEMQIGGSAFAQTRGAVGKVSPTVKDGKYFARAFDAIQLAIKNNHIAAGHDISAGGMLTALLEMCFADVNLGAEIDLSSVMSKDEVHLMFAENTGLIVQATDDSELEAVFSEHNIKAIRIGKPVTGSSLKVTSTYGIQIFDVAEMRDVWYETSYLLDSRQTAGDLAKQRYYNYKSQPLTYEFTEEFTGEAPNIITNKAKPLAAIIREKGSNSEREMANALYRTGWDVRDVHMTDLISGRETLEDVKFLGAVGGFSNSDVLGSAKGWAGAFKYNEKARTALDKFYSRQDTLSVGICNGCQLFLELDLINPDHEQLSKMTYNDSKKHESSFTSVVIQPNNSVMLSSLAGSRLGVWISHGEGKFLMPMDEDRYNIIAKYGYAAYPSNPNGSDYNTAMIASADGRHLATMPHIERSFFQWNWAHYQEGRKDEVSPWAQAFVNAREWV